MTDFSQTPATEAPGWIKKYLDPSEKLVFHARFHPATLLEPVTVFVLGLVATSYADLAVRSTTGRSREVLVLVWVVWVAWALSTIWDYKTLAGFYKGSAVTRLFAFLLTAGILALLGYVGKTRGVGAALWFALLLYALWAFMQVLLYLSHYMVLTNKRLIVVEGIINREVKSLPLGKLSDMIYQRTAMGHALGYGTFDLQAPGASVNLGRLKYVSKPDNTYLQVSHLLWAASAPPDPKKIRLDGQVVEPGPEGPKPRGISLTGEMDG
ncbi:MAG TPA: PH domain-containing protein [Actinospica sp.]|nr:PH domain-containing protein [Actinospica sp.]